METYQNITIEQAKEKITNGDLLIVDIRDQQSFEGGHIDGAIHLTNDNVEAFLSEADLNQPVLVCCYHGHSSQGAAQFLLERGFEEAFSLIGGYTAWAAQEN